jgi:leader peptidase (prepilin peptidase)/N-methyltransferase
LLKNEAPKEGTMHTLRFFGILLASLVSAQTINYFADVLPGKDGQWFIECRFDGVKLKWWRYLLLMPCQKCKTKLPVRNVIVVILIPILFLYALYYSQFFSTQNLVFGFTFFLFTYLGLVFVIDFEHRLVLHVTSAFGLLLCGWIGATLYGFWSMFFGAFAGFAIMFLLYQLGILFIKQVNKKREEPVTEVALGFGDVTLSTVLGALAGWPSIVGVLLIGVLLGGVLSGLYLVVASIRKKHQAFTALPYAPFLIIAALGVFLMAG